MGRGGIALATKLPAWAARDALLGAVGRVGGRAAQARAKRRVEGLHSLRITLPLQLHPPLVTRFRVGMALDAGGSGGGQGEQCVTPVNSHTSSVLAPRRGTAMAGACRRGLAGPLLTPDGGPRPMAGRGMYGAPAAAARTPLPVGRSLPLRHSLIHHALPDRSAAGAGAVEAAGPATGGGANSRATPAVAPDWYPLVGPDLWQACLEGGKG